jgi:hypothetical protein
MRFFQLCLEHSRSWEDRHFLGGSDESFSEICCKPGAAKNNTKELNRVWTFSSQAGGGIGRLAPPAWRQGDIGGARHWLSLTSPLLRILGQRPHAGPLPLWKPKEQQPGCLVAGFALSWSWLTHI